MLDQLAQRERPNGLDRADILLLSKDDAGENNVVHAACAFGNLSKWQLNLEISNRNANWMLFADINAFVCALNDFALKPGTILSIMNARNNKGDTPVHNATQNSQIDCLAALIQRGADLTPS